jgi:hypothetical protein
MVVVVDVEGKVAEIAHLGFAFLGWFVPASPGRLIGFERFAEDGERS